MAHRSRATSLRRASQSAATSRALSVPFASSCRTVARLRVTFFIGRCRSMRTLNLKDRRGAWRIQRSYLRALTPNRRKKTWPWPVSVHRRRVDGWAEALGCAPILPPKGTLPTHRVHDKGAEIVCGFEREAVLVSLGEEEQSCLDPARSL